MDHLNTPNVASSLDATVDLAGVVPIEYQHYGQHQTSIKNIEENLMTEDVCRKPLQAIDYMEHRTNQNENAANIESGHVLLPRCLQCSRCRYLPQMDLKEGRDSDKGTEKDELNEETTDDDVLTKVD